MSKGFESFLGNTLMKNSVLHSTSDALAKKDLVGITLQHLLFA